MRGTGAETPRLFGRRLGRPLRVRKTTLMQELLPRVEIALPECGTVAPERWFDFTPRAVWLEIGFGNGMHLAAQAAAQPGIAMIGCEPFRNGVAGMLDFIDRQALRNVRIYPGDARLLLAALPDAALETIFVLFADPWPKKRHADRRFVQAESLRAMARVLQRGGRLRLASDDPVLQEWTSAQMSQAVDFMPEHGAGISAQRPADWVVTRYEQKALEAGRTPLYYSFIRR